MGYIKYRIGYENSVITENESYSQSIFADQYKQASILIDKFLGHQLEDNLQIISFCGERGSGKSSCMKSMVEMLRNLMWEEKRDESLSFINSLGLTRIQDTKYEIPSVIDPSFFDEKNNILELILGQLYGDLVKYENSHRRTLDRNLCNSVYDSFASIRECMLTLHGNERHSFNDYSELSVLSNNVRLHQSIKDLLENYLKLLGKDKIIFVVDDIDLNTKGAYNMCEQIRKYLCIPQCIVLISFKYEQLHSAISIAINKAYSEIPVSDERISDMANRYLDKFIPASHRVHMPMAYDLCNRTLRIYKDNLVVQFAKGRDSVKDVVVNQIFQKTRFLFYNSKGGVSPIVPNNLRDLFQLLGMLWNMPELPGNKESDERKDILESNKHLFKIYFFNYWTKCLEEKYKQIVREWTMDTQESTLNKSIIKWLAEKFESELNRKYDESIDETQKLRITYIANLITNIKSADNFSYNVSVGDVFYLINLLERDILPLQMERILFFIKSLYSIRMFEAYDIVTSQNERYPKIIEDNGIYRVDHRFDHTNDLQRLLNGGYFTFRPGELIRNSVEGWKFDTRIIKGGSGYLNDIFKNCKTCIENFDKVKSELKELDDLPEKDEKITKRILELRSEEKSLSKIFRLCEFFIFTISRSIPQKEIGSFNICTDSFRKNVNPYALAQFNPQMGYYVFDILTPFYVLCNPQYAYARFDRLIGTSDGESIIFDFAINHDFTLLREMIHDTFRGKELKKSDKDKWLNDLQSDAIIRNAEVLMAMFENIVSLRNTDKSSSGLDKLSAFYKAIQDSHLSTHKVGIDEKDEPYRIKFSFLNALIRFIENDLSDSEMLKLFSNIFDTVEKSNLSAETNSLKKEAKVRLTKTIPQNELTPLEKGKFINRLNYWLGDEPKTASQIWSTLKEKSNSLSNVDVKTLNIYVVRKKRDAKYSTTQLAEYILKDRERYDRWLELLNDLDLNDPNAVI